MKSESAPRGSVSRALCRGMLLAVLAGLAVAPAAQAVTYPSEGGSGFATGTEGWTGSAASCTPGAGGLCEVSNLHATGQGNPPGSIETRMEVLANAGGLFAGAATWRSPSFVATTAGGGSLTYQRQFDASGLAALEPSARIEAVLVDETSGALTSLGAETISTNSEAVADPLTGFASHTEVVPADLLQLGHNYRLQLHPTITTHTAQVGLLGSASLRFDNVALDLRNAGPGGATASRGVRFVRDPISLAQFKHLLRRIDWDAEVGRRAGGSVVRLQDCTIVGTPRSDRITGSRGNDVICGMGGNDRINGSGGRDIVDGGGGGDRLSGARAGDVLAGLAGRDRLRGGSGNDRVGGGAKSERIAGAGGKDRVKGGSGRDRISGNGGKDRLAGGGGRDRLAGNGGRDRISGGAGKDRVVAGKRDRLRSIERGR